MNHNCPRKFGEYQKSDIRCKMCAAKISCERQTSKNNRLEIAKQNKIRSCNPHGYNKYKVNPNPKPKEVEIISRETVAQAYRDFLVAKRNLLSAAQKFHRQNKLFLGLDKIEEEFKETDNPKC